MTAQKKTALKQQSDFPFNHIEFISYDQGSIGHKIFWITQDRRGFMWMLTNNSLSRYDGYTMRSWTHKPGDFNSPIAEADFYTGLMEDKNGMLWFSHPVQGFFSFDPRNERFTNYRNKPGITNSLRSNATRSISIENGEFIWIANSTELNRFDPSTGRFTHFDLQKKSQKGSSYSIKAVLVSKKNKEKNDLWVIDNMLGIQRVDKETGQIINQFDFPFGQSGYWWFTDPDVKVNRIKNEMIWIGSSDKGIYGFDIRSEKFIEIKVDRTCNSSGHFGGLYNVLEDNEGNLWTVNDNNEIVYFDRSIQRFYFYRIDRADTRFLDNNAFFFEDNSSNIWLAAENRIIIIKRNEKPFFRSEHVEEKALSVSGNYFFDIFRASHNELFVGAVPLNIFDPRTKKLSPFKFPLAVKDFETFAVRYIDEDSKKFVWLSGDFGIVCYDPVLRKAKQRELYVDGVKVHNEGFRGIIEDRRGIYWAVNKQSGLYQFDPLTGKAKRLIKNQDSILVQEFSSGFLSSSDILYLGTMTGSFITFNPKERIFIKYYFNENNSDRRINEKATCFFESKNGLIWFGTQGAGLGVFDPSAERFSFFTSSEGFGSNIVYSLVKDKKGTLWAGTSSGLTSFAIPGDPFSGSTKIDFRNYNSSDGLPAKPCNYNAAFCDNDGTLYFGTRGSGIVYFHPDSLKDNQFKPPVYITEVKLKNKPLTLFDSGILKEPVEFVSKLKLKHSQNIISFSFTALNYTHAEKNQYAYKLENYDDDWIYTDASKRFADYTNLDPGKYTFKVKGSNNDGEWNHTPIELIIVITPPFWQTTWFRVLVAMAVAGIIYAFYRYRIGQLLLLQKIRNKIAADLHDDIGSTLNSISVYSEVAKKDAARKEHALTMIGESSRKIIDSMSDIVWSINPENDDFDKIIFRMRSLTYNLLKAKKIDCVFKADENLNGLKLAMQTRRNFYLIFKEALTNLVKYSQADRANVTVTNGGQQVVLLVRDNGIGFNVFAKHNGNGIKNIMKRADEIKAKLNIESSKEEGTTIELILRT